MLGVVPEVDTVIPDVWIPERGGVMLDTFTEEGLFTFEAPLFYKNGVEQHGGYVARGDLLALGHPDHSGTVYYTLDGSDPVADATAMSATSMSHADRSPSTGKVAP